MIGVFVDAEKMAALMNEEKHVKAENLRLQRKLQMEIERREALCRHLSESESSLEMDDERLVWWNFGQCTNTLMGHQHSYVYFITMQILLLLVEGMALLILCDLKILIT